MITWVWILCGIICIADSQTDDRCETLKDLTFSASSEEIITLMINSPHTFDG